MTQRDIPGSSESIPPARAVYERYAVALNRYLIRRARRPEDVADLTQEIFELFVRRSNRQDVIRNPLAYLFRIAFHVVGAALSEHQRSPVSFDSRRLEDNISETQSSSGEDAEELAVQEDMKTALQQLPENYLTALLLVEGEGMSYKEAARASGFSPNTIATYVMHGRAALKLALHTSTPRKNSLK